MSGAHIGSITSRCSGNEPSAPPPTAPTEVPSREVEDRTRENGGNPRAHRGSCL